jgi:hypothetical protein
MPIAEKSMVLRSAWRNSKTSFIPFCFSSKAQSNRDVRTRRQGVHPQDRRLVLACVRTGAAKKPPDFMTLLNHAAPRTQEQRSTIVDALTRTYTHLPLCHGHTLFIVTDIHQHIDRGLYTYMTSYLAQAYRLSILIDKPILFINSLLIRLWFKW